VNDAGAAAQRERNKEKKKRELDVKQRRNIATKLFAVD
jgi:hypothetical protein